MTKQQVIALIQQWIVANGNEEITADVLRPILEAMVNQPNDLIGDLNDLTTINNDTVVDAINEVNNLSNGGITIHYGSDIPFITPPVSFELGDFYAQLDGSSVLGFWQYNGNDWIEIKEVTGGVQSVTGDGVDNTDPENPVLTFPTPADIGALDSIFTTYSDINALIADQGNQVDQLIYEVVDASGDSNITFPAVVLNRQAFYRYNGTATGSIDDYTLISAPFSLINPEFAVVNEPSDLRAYPTTGLGFFRIYVKTRRSTFVFSNNLSSWRAGDQLADDGGGLWRPERVEQMHVQERINYLPKDYASQTLEASFGFDFDSQQRMGFITVKPSFMQTSPAWQLASWDEELYFRKGEDETWEDIHRLVHSGNLSEFIDTLSLKEEEITGTRLTDASVTGSTPLDWDAYKVFEFTLTGATTLTDTNLPTGTETKVIELVISGNQVLTLPAYWEALPSNDAYDGTVRNHLVVSCIDGDTNDIIYSLQNLSS